MMCLLDALRVCFTKTRDFKFCDGNNFSCNMCTRTTRTSMFARKSSKKPDVAKFSNYAAKPTVHTFTQGANQQTTL